MSIDPDDATVTDWVKSLGDGRQGVTAPILTDLEAVAMQRLATAMDGLDADARDRVVNYAYSRWHSPPADADGPRTFWLDDLPVDGDLLCHGGREFPIGSAGHVNDGREVTYRLTAVLRSEPTS